MTTNRLLVIIFQTSTSLEQLSIGSLGDSFSFVVSDNYMITTDGLLLIKTSSLLVIGNLPM